MNAFHYRIFPEYYSFRSQIFCLNEKETLDRYNKIEWLTRLNDIKATRHNCFSLFFGKCLIQGNQTSLMIHALWKQQNGNVYDRNAELNQTWYNLASLFPLRLFWYEYEWGCLFILVQRLCLDPKKNPICLTKLSVIISYVKRIGRILHLNIHVHGSEYCS